MYPCGVFMILQGVVLFMSVCVKRLISFSVYSLWGWILASGLPVFVIDDLDVS